MSKTKDTGLEVLLALNGDRYFVDEKDALTLLQDFWEEVVKQL